MSTIASDIPTSRHGEPGHAQRSLAELLFDLWRETTTLVRDEAELAKADMSEKVAQAASSARSMAAGGAILLAGFIVVLFAAVNALAMALPADIAPWLAPLLVGGVVMLIGVAAVARGRKDMKAERHQLNRTADSLRRDRDLVKEHAK